MISNIDFIGGIVATLLDAIEGSLRGLIADKIKAFLCEYMGDLQELGIGFLGNLTDFVDPYLNSMEFDPMAPELVFNRTVSPGVDLINFQDPEGFLALTVTTLLQKASQLLGDTRDDANSPTGTGQDLGINLLIREFLLDDNRTFEISPTAFGFLNNGVLLDGAVSNITEMEVRIDRVKLQGLDTFTRFDSFDVLGEYTLQGSFALKYMILEFDVFIAVGPPGSDEKVEETITVSSRFDDLSFSFAGLVAVRSASLGALQLSNLLDPSAIIPCFFSTAEALNITSLNATVGSISDLAIRDFESPGLARVITTGIEGLYQLFNDVFVAALPGLFQTTVKDLVNEQIALNMNGAGCVDFNIPTGTSELVDFRDLFYEPSKAKSLGGSGAQPYGVITKLVRDLVDDLLLSTDPSTGMPRINKELIVPLTHFLSGSDGQFKFNGTLLSFRRGVDFGEFSSEIVFEVYDAKIDNIDSIVSPLVLLQPTNRSGSELDNDVTFGLNDRPLQGSARVFVSMQGEGKKSSILIA